MHDNAAELKAALIRPGIAAACVTTGCVFVDYTGALWAILASGLVLGTIAAIICARSRFITRETAALPTLHQDAHLDENAQYVQDLFSPYTQCAALAAEQLGKTGDAAVVPSLISVLDRSAWREEPGWEQVCEAIVVALVSIGDGRAVPALNRISGARGPEFRAFVADSIASISNSPPRVPVGQVPDQSNEYGQITNGSTQAAAPSKSNRPPLIPLGDESAFQDSLAC
jgi:hypothetical protein